MIDKWFNDDINAVLNNHNRIVVTDTNNEGRFLLDYLPSDIYVIDAEKGKLAEIEARFIAENNYPENKIIFYTRDGLNNLTFLLEYAETYGCVVLDDMETYIKRHLFYNTKENTELSRSDLLMAAKLSVGKDLTWWKSVSAGITKPLDTDALVLELLKNSKNLKDSLDIDIWNTLVSEIYILIDKPNTSQPEQILAQSIADAIFDGLIHNNISDRLLNIYYLCADSNSMTDVMKKYISNYKLPQNVSICKIHPDHCFEDLDKQFFKALSLAVENENFLGEFINMLNARVSSSRANYYKSSWLSDLKILMEFKTEKLYEINSLNNFSNYYQVCFSLLDTAMRHLYVAWLNEESILRPFQYRYEQYNKELLDKWFSLLGAYQSNQKNILSTVFSSSERIAIIVCDGLRLEIAESLAKRIDYKKTKKMVFSEIPSVTEKGMSALFGCDGVEEIAQNRYNVLKQLDSEAEIIQLENLNSGITANHLVLMFGDIDQVGEKKQLAGLKDIDAYENFIIDKIEDLFSLGYSRVFLTTDHGFVITGILDEADKIPVPNADVKVDERFILSKESIKDTNLIEINKEFKGFQYQYFAKSDKPFISKGAYGYAHGGFTPQECIIPMYEFIADKQDALKIEIVNKDTLSNITGVFFTVKLRASNENSLFSSARKVVLQIYEGSKLVTTSSIFKMSPSDIRDFEFNMPPSGRCKIVVIDIQTEQQLDFCEIKKSSSRDLEGLF